MSQRTSTIAPRSWAVRSLLVCMLAMCALMVHAPHGAAAAMAPASHSTSGSTSHDQAQDQRGDRCSCCPTPLDIAVACATVNTGPPQQHGTLPQALDEDAFAAPGLASSGSAAQRAAPPPSLAELSLLRI
ncbi:MAG: hypothetical protein QOH87_4872 [Trebonia sp.]|nr:hypothetical protein [Trebonia sp.]